jgi:hypothetical protein
MSVFFKCFDRLTEMESVECEGFNLHKDQDGTGMPHDPIRIFSAYPTAEKTIRGVDVTAEVVSQLREGEVCTCFRGYQYNFNRCSYSLRSRACSLRHCCKR